MPEINASKYLVTAGWDDAPHLDAQTKAELLKEIPPHLRKARTEGIPSLGTGAIYPLEEELFVVDPFRMPAYWPRCYGMDVGWNRTAVPWLAWDRDEDVAYVYAEYYRANAEPSIHAAAIKARGDWIPGAIDPAANGRSQIDGKRLYELYRALGLHLNMADNSVEAGIYAVWDRLSTGRLKVFSTCVNWLTEYREYHRDDNGKVVKELDHLMDGTRYAIMTGLKNAIIRPKEMISSAGPTMADRTGGY
jgi:hypothetical protein